MIFASVVTKSTAIIARRLYESRSAEKAEFCSQSDSNNNQGKVVKSYIKCAHVDDENEFNFQSKRPKLKAHFVRRKLRKSSFCSPFKLEQITAIVLIQMPHEGSKKQLIIYGDYTAKFKPTGFNSSGNLLLIRMKFSALESFKSREFYSHSSIKANSSITKGRIESHCDEEMVIMRKIDVKPPDDIKKKDLIHYNLSLSRRRVFANEKDN